MASDLARKVLFRRLALFAVLVTVALIMLGAYVRLTDAGLGCPDWPGCYGQLTPAHAAEQIRRQVDIQGGEHGPVSMGKAWREMGHRYVAMALGLLVILLAVLTWRWRRALSGGPWLATLLVAVVILQGLFGKWTVTLLLRPAIVTGHLIGGMLTMALLVWLWRRQADTVDGTDTDTALGSSRPGTRLGALALPSTLALIALSAQIILGGWTSTNYAALACTDLPTCQGQWWPQADFASGFQVFRELGKTAAGDNLSASALTAIHLTHRIGALIAAACLVWLAVLAMRPLQTRALGGWLLLALLCQLILGLSNVWFSLPLAVAVAHNGMAAILLALVVMIKSRIKYA